MGDKSIQKKNYIVEKARDVFRRRGYRAVTMKDIVEACEISRGGLYLYFASTRELFEAVLEQELAGVSGIMETAGTRAETPGEIMLIYLSNQKKSILKKKDSLFPAVCEYLFENKLSGNDNPVRNQFDRTVGELELLIRDGVEQEWMICDDAAAAARNIAYIIQGMRITAQTTGLTADDVDREIEYIMGTLGMVIE